jgi:molybdate transport system ATP-binding protein
LALEPPGPSSILNVLEATVAEIGDHGPHQVNVRLAIGRACTPLLARITRRSLETLMLRPGAVVYAQIKSAALFV